LSLQIDIIMADEDYVHPDLEIVGLSSASNGRSCCQHHICGEHVAANDVLRLVKCVVVANGRTEEAVKLVKIVGGSDTCTVAFVPRVFADAKNVQDHLNKFVQVLEIYKESENTHKRYMSHQNCGMASVVFLDDIPVDE
jgi:hypothetical protein